MSDERPYGSWPSPVTAAMVARSGVELGEVALDDGTAWWLERRPGDGGRGVVVRQANDGTPVDVTPEDHDVRTLVHEYGGGDFLVEDGTLYYANFDDQRVYRLPPEGDPRPVTPAPEVERGLRYADFDVSPDGTRIFCVRERHFADDREPENAVVSFPADGSAEPTVVAGGNDFYAAPRVSPDGETLAWITWDHPSMPWDSTRLRVGTLTGDGAVADDRTVMGGGEDPESVVQPRWGAGGRLYAVSDRTNWWNLFHVDLETGDQVNLCPTRVEFAVPQWRLGYSTYAFLDDGRIATTFVEDGVGRLGFLADGDLEPAGLPYATYAPYLATDGERLLFVAGAPDRPDAVVSWRPGRRESVLRRAADVDLDASYVADPERLSFPTDDPEHDAHAFYYPPTSPEVTPPDDELPPLVVIVHGGPTSQTRPGFSLGIQFLTTRGIAVADVNYRGSSGYGRAYRDRLDGEWGVVDVVDCVRAAEYLANRGDVDPDRLAIKGGSAGGYATLAALAFHDAFDAGVSYYGVADLAALAEHTHKFESRYLDGLVGPYPGAEDLYRERSPVHHADRIAAPVLLLQGEDDPVVPPEQAEAMTGQLAESGIPHAYLAFEDEQHGFRKAENVERAHEAELSFLGQVFGFDPDDDLEPIDLES